MTELTRTQKVEQFRLEQRVKIIGDTTYHKGSYGTVTGKYSPATKQNSDLKVLIDGKSSPSYYKLENVMPVETVTAYCYKTAVGEYVHMDDPDLGPSIEGLEIKRFPQFDVRKEIVG